MKKKLVFIIDSDLYIRNYFETGVLKKLSKIYDIFYIFSSEVTNKKFIKKNKKFLGYYSFSNFKKRVYYLFNNIFNRIKIQPKMKDLLMLFLIANVALTPI